MPEPAIQFLGGFPTMEVYTRYHAFLFLMFSCAASVSSAVLVEVNFDWCNYIVSEVLGKRVLLAKKFDGGALSVRS